MDDPIASPTSLADLVAYQPGSVVSRVLMKNQGGVVTVFAFGEGEGLSEHSTPHDASMVVLDGSVSVDIGGERHEVGAGEMLRLPSDVPHSLQGTEPFKMLLVLLKRPIER